MRPRVGVTCSTTIHEERDLVALEEVYAEAVSRAGGLPFVLPTLERPMRPRCSPRSTA